MTNVSSSGVIAERSVDLLRSFGRRVTFGPILSAGRDFRCRVRFYGWGDSPPDICGYDSLDAFVHALTLVHSILHEFVQRGGRVLWPGSNNDYSMESFISSPEYREAKPAILAKRHPPRRGTGRKVKSGRRR